MASLVVQAAEFQMFSPFKEVDSRIDNALNSAEFISANGIPNHIGAAVPGSPFAGNTQSTAGMASYGLMADERTVFETFTMATVNHTYTDDNGEELQLTGENNAKFGEGKLFPAQGKLVHVTSAKDVTDNTACHPNIRGTAGQKLPAEPWIALIKRGVCKFEDKVKHAYLHNAIAVIVYNDRESSSLDKMQIVDKESKCRSATFEFYNFVQISGGNLPIRERYVKSHGGSEKRVLSRRELCEYWLLITS